MTTAIHPMDAASVAALDAKMKAPKRTALVAGAAFAAAIAGWSALAPLSSATIASGMVSPDSGRKTIQHLEGGIVEKILVNEGDRIDEGQIVAVLVDAKAKATREQQVRRRVELMAQKARLDALAANADEPDFAAITVDDADVSLAQFLRNERAAFQARRAAFLAKIHAQKQDIAAMEATNAAIAAQVKASREEMVLIQDEMATKNALLEKGLTTRPQVQALNRRRTQIDAQLAQLEGQNGNQLATIEQKKSTLANEIAAFRNDVAEQAAKNATELASVESQLSASNDALRRMEVRAPEAGTVVSLKVRTPGAVLAPAAPVVDFVPAAGGAVLDVRVKPTDIAHVQPGQPAQVILTAFSQREVPMLPATVKTVSADAVTDPATRETYYKAELRINEAEAKKLAPNIPLVAGMPVESYISHHERTLLEWLAEPVIRTFQRGGREF